jgi:HlyD family secretion protein
MFRVKVKIAPELLKKHVEKVKTGLPGVAYVRMDPNAKWPERLSAVLAQ